MSIITVIILDIDMNFIPSSALVDFIECCKTGRLGKTLNFKYIIIWLF